MFDLFIIAAGIGSRMNTALPKALVPIEDGIPNITTTLQQIGHKFNQVYIVINEKAVDVWDDYFCETRQKYPELLTNVQAIDIKSGLGDGHAVMSALDAISGNCREDIIVCWGDVFICDPRIIDELQADLDNKSGAVAAVYKKDPYVTLITDENKNIVRADFSKNGEHHCEGFHDQSIFRFKRECLRSSLLSLHRALKKNDDKYMTSNGELSLLHVFHFLYHSQKPCTVIETQYPTMGFNTVEEVSSIQKEISGQWNLAHI